MEIVCAHNSHRSGAAVGLVLVRTQRRRHKRRKEAHGPADLLARYETSPFAARA